MDGQNSEQKDQNGPSRFADPFYDVNQDIQFVITPCIFKDFFVELRLLPNVK